MFDRPTRPKANLPALFSTDDYPLESIRNAEQGTVSVVLRVAADGRLLDCIVARSSGFPALDSQTCRIMWLRVRFQPARDRYGRPVESALTQRIQWKLPDRDPIPIKAWSARLAIEFVEAGGVVSCKFDAIGALKSKSGGCEFWLRLSNKSLSALRADAGYKRRKVVLDTLFSPTTTYVERSAPDGLDRFGRQLARLTVDNKGKALQCKVIEAEGPPPADECEDLLDQRYEAPGIAAGAVELTVVRSVYVTR
jgi:TonB family protein